jgi:hypothetical protein
MTTPTTLARALAEDLDTGPTLTLARRSATPAAIEPAGSLFGRVVPWDTPTEVSDGGRRRYTESFARGGLVADGVVPVYAGHVVVNGRLERGPLVGRVDDAENREDGLWGRVTLADVPAARELRALADLVGATFSVEFEGSPPPRGVDAVVRTDSRWTGLAVLTAPARGAYAEAEVTAVRAAPDEAAGDEDPDEDGDEDGTDGEQGDGDAGPEGAPVARAYIEREVRRALGRAAGRPTPHPLARFTSAYQFMDAARASASDELPRLFAVAYHEHRARVDLGRVLVDQVTGDNPGVIPPAWLSEVFGVIDTGRPVITAIGPRPLPPAGMEIDWPYFDGDLHALVGEQLAQKTEITSVKVSLKRASTAIKTYAGGSDLSWQLIRRSQPSYREAYLRIMQAAYGVVTDAAVGDQVAAVPGHQTVDYDVAVADPDGTLLRAAIFEASVLVQRATGSPASFVLAAADVFVRFGGMPTMVPSSYGTQNVTGTAQASTLDVNVSGLQVTLALDLDPGTCIVSNRQACAWFEDGPFVVAAPDIPKLGEDVAVWGMGGFGAFIGAGVVLLEPDVTPLAADTEASSRTSTTKAKAR